eukprot:COSAG01_NODE_2401_length_7759_cov_54.707572_2_plen_103_part_00
MRLIATHLYVLNNIMAARARVEVPHHHCHVEHPYVRVETSHSYRTTVQLYSSDCTDSHHVPTTVCTYVRTIEHSCTVATVAAATTYRLQYVRTYVLYIVDTG